MKKKVTRPLIKVNKKVHVVHLNVGSGYVTYLEEDCRQGDVRVRGILLEAPERKRAAKN
jgi:hypothetical protein